MDFQQQADVYLQRFREEALSAIARYETTATKILGTQLSMPHTEMTAAQTAQVNLLRTVLEDLKMLSE